MMEHVRLVPDPQAGHDVLAPGVHESCAEYCEHSLTGDHVSAAVSRPDAYGLLVAAERTRITWPGDDDLAWARTLMAARLVKAAVR